MLKYNIEAPGFIQRSITARHSPITSLPEDVLVKAPGRPKTAYFQIKQNKSRWTIKPVGGEYWKFLPFTGLKGLQTFLLDVDAKWNPNEDLGLLTQGKVITVAIPSNREPHFHAIYKQGAAANPFSKFAAMADRNNYYLQKKSFFGPV